MLLQGGKTWAGMIAVGMVAAVIAAAPVSAPLAAQDASSLAGRNHSFAVGHLDVAVTCNSTLSNIASSSSFWMQGGSVEVEGRFYRSLGAVADIAGSNSESRWSPRKARKSSSSSTTLSSRRRTDNGDSAPCHSGNIEDQHLKALFSSPA
jgi:hypothetical protein